MSNVEQNGFSRDDPHRGPLERTANALDGHDDPNPRRPVPQRRELGFARTRFGLLTS